MGRLADAFGPSISRAPAGKTGADHNEERGCLVDQFATIFPLLAIGLLPTLSSRQGPIKAIQLLWGEEGTEEQRWREPQRPEVLDDALFRTGVPQSVRFPASNFGVSSQNGAPPSGPARISVGGFNSFVTSMIMEGKNITFKLSTNVTAPASSSGRVCTCVMY